MWKTQQKAARDKEPRGPFLGNEEISQYSVSNVLAYFSLNSPSRWLGALLHKELGFPLPHIPTIPLAPRTLTGLSAWFASRSYVFQLPGRRKMGECMCDVWGPVSNAMNLFCLYSMSRHLSGGQPSCKGAWEMQSLAGSWWEERKKEPKLKACGLHPVSPRTS